MSDAPLEPAPDNDIDLEVDVDDFPEPPEGAWDLTEDDIADGNHLGTTIDTDDDLDGGDLDENEVSS